MKTHCNIPFFIPHSGCKNDCVFCSQEKITGKQLKKEEINTQVILLQRQIEEYLPTIKNKSIQLAFFGGSFTGIEHERMLCLLKTAKRYIDESKIKSIRISTRPDYIDQEILNILKEYGVCDIELGIQSMNQNVLDKCNRGCKAEKAIKSGELIKQNGFKLTGQMMIGLPCSVLKDEIETAQAIIKMKADNARIYPTVIFKNTQLHKMYLSGEYVPLTLEQAVERGGECLSLFVNANVELLRIGLYSSPELEQGIGPNHPAIGELIKGQVYYNKLKPLIKSQNIKIYIPIGEKSKLTGHNGFFLDRINAKNIEIKEKDIKLYSLEVENK